MKKKLKGGLTNLRGDVVGDLTVLRKGPMQKTKTGRKRAQWVCECTCGETVLVAHNRLIDKKSPKTHCGCKNRGLPTQYPVEYHTWHSMIQRCHNPTHHGYKDYGAKGVTVCKSWRDPEKGFERFFKHMGERPEGRTIDRKNPFKGYSPNNVRWATSEEQANNQRRHWDPKTGKKRE